MPQMGNKYAMDLSVFDGGLNTQVPAQNLPSNQSPNMNAVVFDNYGAIQSPAGHQTHNSVPIGAGIDGAMSYKPAAMSAMLLGVGGSLYVATGVGTAFATVSGSTDVFTPEYPVDAVQFQELAFLANGEQQPYKFNGSEITRAGVSAPTQNISAVCDAAGSLTGAYQYVFWGVNSYAAEGDYGTPSTAVTIASGQIRINNIPTAPASYGIEYWKVERNTAGASDVFWYLTDVTNGATSFTDSILDSSLTIEAPIDQGYLRKFRILCAYAGRLWGAADDSLLWFSNINQPEEFPSTNYVHVGRGDGLQISAITPFKGMIVISKSDFNGKTALYQLLIGDSVTFGDPDNWNLMKVSDYGASESQRACVTYSDYLTLANRDGIYAFNGFGFSGSPSQSTNGSFISERISENIEYELDGGVLSPGSGFRSPGVSAVNWKEAVWFGVKIPNSGNALYIYDYSRISGSKRSGAWTKQDTYGGLTYNFPSVQFVKHESFLFATRGAYFFKMDNGDYYTTSTGTQVGPFRYLTPRLVGVRGHESNFKDFRFLFVTCSGQGSLLVRTSNDGFDSTAESDTITLTADSTRHKINLGATKGRDVQVRFDMTFGSGDNVTITRLEVFYNLRGLRM